MCSETTVLALIPFGYDFTDVKVWKGWYGRVSWAAYFLQLLLYPRRNATNENTESSWSKPIPP